MQHKLVTPISISTTFQNKVNNQNWTVKY